MSTPDNFKCAVLKGRLYDDAQNGRGTDLEVKVPTGTTAADDQEKTKSFHLHHNILAASSRYFTTFPDPKSGRIINDIDTKSFLSA